MSDITPAMFDKLLRRLDPDRHQAGEKLNQLQQRLVKLFQWSGCSFPEKWAQKVMDGLATGIEKEATILDVDKYINGVAKNVLKEAYREQKRAQAAHDQVRQLQAVLQNPAEQERRHTCYKECMARLPTEERELVEQYFQGEKSVKIENRKRLAERWQMAPNTLSVRCWRIREKLKKCFAACLQR